MGRRLGGPLLFSVCLLCLSPLRAMAQSGAIPTVGIYNCYSDLPAEDIPFFKACGYNLYQSWDLGWGQWPTHLDQYYADKAQNLQQMKSAGFKTNVLLSINMNQRQAGQPEGYQASFFDPGDQALMQQRLGYITQTVDKLKTADVFTIFAGDPGGYDTATPEQLYTATKDIIGIIRQKAPQAQINVDTWGIAAWDHNPSPFTVELWQKEVQLTNALISRPDILGPDVNIEFPLHNYYRSLALQCYSQAGEQPQLCPTAGQVAALKQRGVTQLWGWPYFVTDECDDGYQPGTAGAAQGETRYIKQIIDTGRQLGLNGMTANAMAPNIFAESLNLYAFGRFCKDATATPEQVISDFAGFIAQPGSTADLARVVKYIENQSTWQSGLPAQNRLPNFNVGPLTTVAAAYDSLCGVGIRLQSDLPIPGTPAAYVGKLKERLRSLGGSSIPGSSTWTVFARFGTALNGTVDGVDADHNLSLVTTGGDVLNALSKKGGARSDTDSVSVTLKNFSGTIGGAARELAGLVISASPAPSLSPSEATYSFYVSQNATGDICYVLAGANGFTAKTGPWLSSAPSVFDLDIVRDGAAYVFKSNGDEIFRDSTYSSLSMPYYFLEWGSQGGGLLNLNADRFGIVAPEPGTLTLLGIGLAWCLTCAWRKRKQE